MQSRRISLPAHGLHGVSIRQPQPERQIPPAYRDIADGVESTYDVFVRRHAHRAVFAGNPVDKLVTRGPLPLSFFGAPAAPGENNFAALRLALTNSLGAHANAPFVQVIGDSGTSFSEQGAQRAMRVVELPLAATDGGVLAYGATASDGDANWIAGEYLRTHQQTCVVGNLVHQTVDAIVQWKCSVSPVVRHFVLAFHANGDPTMFGDDTDVSDKVMSGAKGDVLVCLEGGPQSLVQCLNALQLGVQIIACDGLRTTGLGKARFSAATLLLRLRAAVESGNDLTDAVKAYVNECDVSERHHCAIKAWATRIIENIAPTVLVRLIRAPFGCQSQA